MKTTKKIELPILKDIVVPGKDMPEVDELPSVLSDIQIRALEQQIERIVQFKLEAVLKHATKEAVKEINAHLDQVLPKLIQAANKRQHRKR
ncbi:MAG: hypothetical protein DRQ49_07035 [Gammaproteobacteria bacterium]|nr:MAG: hypothetical protein DRQ49_07035 [Gammaproteobacteria bacterium]RKZ42890.1 MAG: hypothetical protein DRQ41_06475 [Gammaproteobacteria bacterium]RKZ76514.1 MAG: hypothetical protein DRQ57_03650 [Gammaproteobacteria bacterium]